LDRLLPALIAGYETGGALEQAYGRVTTSRGFRSTALYGPLAAAAAAAKLMSLSVEQTAAAISNGASFTGGTLQSFAEGTDEWRYQVGVAADLGFTAAELARAGSIAAPEALEGKSGFIRSFARSEADTLAITSMLGREWSVRRVTFKPHPVCAFNQTPVTAAIVLSQELRGSGIKAVRVKMNPFETGYAGMDATGPFDSISGTLMSIPFCIATTLLYGAPNIARMTTYDDSGVNAVIRNISLLPDESVPTLSAIIEVDVDDGRTLRHVQSMTTDDYSFDRQKISSLIRRIGSEEEVPSSAFDLLEDFIADLPNGPIAQVLEAFSMLSGRS